MPDHHHQNDLIILTLMFGQIAVLIIILTLMIKIIIILTLMIEMIILTLMTKSQVMVGTVRPS